LKASESVFLVYQSGNFTYGRFKIQHVLCNKDNLHAWHEDRYQTPGDSIPWVHRWGDDIGAY